MLRLVHSRKVVCWPWHLRGMDEVPTFPAICRECDRDVAAPEARRGDVPLCLYCAMACGLIPEEEVPLGGDMGFSHI